MTDIMNCLKEMRSHAKNNIASGNRTAFNISAHFSQFNAQKDVNALSANEDQIVGGLKGLAQSLSQDEASSIESGLIVDTQKLKDSGVSTQSQTDFKSRLEQRRGDAKKKSNENIDRIFDEAERVAKANPGSEELILRTLDLAMNLFQIVFDKIAAFFSQIIDTIVNWVKNAWQNIKSTFNGITNTISGWFRLAAA